MISADWEDIAMRRKKRKIDVSELWWEMPSIGSRYEPKDLGEPPRAPEGYEELMYRATMQVVDAERRREPKDRLFP